MKWYLCSNSTRWGIEFSKSGLVEHIRYERGNEHRSFKKEPKLAEEPLTEEVLMDAFEAIIRGSDTGTHDLAHEVMGEDARILDEIALYEQNRCDAIREAVKGKF